MPFIRPAGSRQGLQRTALAALLACWVIPPLEAQQAEAGTDRLVDCGTSVSLDKRLVMQQWGAPGRCDQPAETRASDRFLGFTCVERGIEVATCRAYFPGADSRTYDTAKFFRCVDLALTGSVAGIMVSRVREWASAKDECDWDPAADILAMEVDFENGQVCAATLCMPVERLTIVGKVRLKYLLDSAFKDLELAAQAGPQAVRPIRAGAR